MKFNPNVLIHYDTEAVGNHLKKFKKFDPFKHCTTFSNHDAYLKQKFKIKLAVVCMPYPLGNDIAIFQKKVKQLIKVSEHIFIIASEVHPETISTMKLFDFDFITFYICGSLNFDLKKAKVKNFMYWFESSSYFYRYWLPEILTRLHPFEEKKQYFDILLGRKREHRDYIFNQFKNNEDIGILTYFEKDQLTISNGPTDGFSGPGENKWIWELEGVSIFEPLDWTISHVNYYGYRTSVCKIIPINIYNQTAYSVVAETCFDNNFTFFTEKTAKPIIAKRLFVTFAGKHHLLNLKKLGFKTFDNVIDESYDDEPIDILRWKKACDQVLWLSKQPQLQIINKVKHILEHNYNLMMTTNWEDNFRSELEKDIVRIICKRQYFYP